MKPPEFATHMCEAGITFFVYDVAPGGVVYVANHELEKTPSGFTFFDGGYQDFRPPGTPLPVKCPNCPNENGCLWPRRGELPETVT